MTTTPRILPSPAKRWELLIEFLLAHYLKTNQMDKYHELIAYLEAPEPVAMPVMEAAEAVKT